MALKYVGRASASGQDVATAGDVDLLEVTALATWGYIPTVVVATGATLPTPLPAIGVVIERV